MMRVGLLSMTVASSGYVEGVAVIERVRDSDVRGDRHQRGARRPPTAPRNRWCSGSTGFRSSCLPPRQFGCGVVHALNWLGERHDGLLANDGRTGRHVAPCGAVIARGLRGRWLLGKERPKIDK